MRESTDLRCVDLAETPGSPPSADSDYFSKRLFFLDLSDNAAEDWLAGGPIVSTSNTVDMSACEFVYGIPFQLLAIMGKTSELIRRKRTFTKHFPASALPQILSAACDELETEILEWPVDRIITEVRNQPIAEESQHLIEHQTRAFHQALVIYFSHLVRSVHHRHLQPYVYNIIDHLEAVEVIKHGANLATGCILWPGFIGAAQAIDKNVQSRYLQWFRSTRFYGLGAYDKACEVVLEVWQRRKSAKNQGCDWLNIVESNDVRLMLT